MLQREYEYEIPVIKTCSGYQILSQLYSAQGMERTAQHFVATPVGTGAEESINVINVHAPSGTKKLSDTQRTMLVTSLLQSNSLSDATKFVGHDRYVIAAARTTADSVSALLA